MGFATNVFLNLSIYVADILAPTIIGAQLSIPFGHFIKFNFFKGKSKFKKMGFNFY